uniref:Innexin n=1 Tax=Panagrolaimus sp. ES5 TaxID=591445 RepID=A0AC34G6W9_9BILA
MIILGFANLLTRTTKPRYDEDMVDRFNNRFAAYVLIAAGITIFGNNMGGNPVQCWEKPNWHSSWSEYASDYCFIEGTYFAPLNGTLPAADGYKDLKKLSFYQWTPFILTLLGVMFTLPRSLWSFINWSSSLNMTTILTEGSKTKKTGLPSREFIKFSTCHVKDVLKRRRFSDKNNLVKRLWSKMFGTYYLTAWYILVKIFNILCVFIALVVITTLVADDSNSFLGFATIRALSHGEDWRKTGIFPRLTVCRFQIREQGVLDQTNMVSKVTQCVLLTNMYIEKIYIVVWHGLIMLLCVNILNLARFIYLLIAQNRKSFLINMMMPALNYIFPKLDNDLKWPVKLRHYDHIVENKLKHLQNEKRHENPNASEIAQREYLEALQKRDESKQAALEKRLKKRENFRYHLNHDIHKFVEYLGADGYLTIRLLYANAGNFIAGAMVAKLFWKYVKQPQQKS